ncbi:trehalase-like domain-containing protein, partial [Corynebacterium sp.]|uniref:trehalase-like domain-containing protein n=1 Tax=Corynebacterium sp. TaxID=1720 RepID=UPI0026E0095C
MTTERSTPIEKYALLSDTHTAALVAEGGSIDWLCLPRFDSQAVFTRLLGTEEHGHWRIDAPGARVLGRRYLGNSFVLETTWESDTGTAVVTDFMPMDPDNGRFECTDLLRQVRCTSGEID